MEKCIWVRPELVAQIEFLEWTESDHLRHSKFAGSREDILNSAEAKPSEYYSVWILSIFQHHESWGHAEDLLKIFRETSSDVVRRFAALGLATCGSRAQALAIKDYLSTGSSLRRTAMLLATAKLGKDERKHFSKSLQLNDSLEKLCATTSI